MTIRFRVSLLFLLLLSPFSLWAADPVELLLVRITPQVIERDQSVSWEQSLSKLTQAGNPVVVNIDADSLAIRVTVTPFVRGKDFLLVVQGDVRQRSSSGTRRSTTLQSLLVPPGEAIAFFPLGRDPGETGRQMVVRMQVELQSE